jgi:methyltransferase-like protein/trans-aconitate methyltransferase
MRHTATGTRSSYDEVPYASYPFPQTHPDRLATIAHLLGLTAAPPRHCRVLELGCAAGGNLIPMAVALPQAQFVGIDLSAVQVAEGQAIIDALGLDNIRLEAASILDVDASWGSFDYIVAHGVYSWVPDAVQQKMLAICARQLAADGVAYVSYNTLPGWRMRGMIRDLMRYHAMSFTEPAQRVGQARAILDFLARSVPTANNPYGLALRAEAQELAGQPDYYILHEHLEDINEPLYFHEFAARAAAHGLQYLGEADFGTMLASNFPREVDETVRRIAPDLIRQEQFIDFLRNRTFRQTLLVHEGRAIEREVHPDRLTALAVASALQPAHAQPNLADPTEESFRAPNGGTLRTPNPVTKAAIVVLAREWPAALPFATLLERATALLAPAGKAVAADGLTPARTLASDLLQCYAAGLIELRTEPPRFVTRPGDRPLAGTLARLQAAHGLTRLTNLRHETVDVTPPIARLLQLLDGSRDRDTLQRIALGWTLAGADGFAPRGGAPVAAAHNGLERALTELARAALLLA